MYRQIWKTSAAFLALMKLPGCEGMSRAVNTQTAKLGELNRKLNAFLEQNRRLAVVLELIGRMDKNLEKLQARLNDN